MVEEETEPKDVSLIRGGARLLDKSSLQSPSASPTAAIGHRRLVAFQLSTLPPPQHTLPHTYYVTLATSMPSEPRFSIIKSWLIAPPRLPGKGWSARCLCPPLRPFILTDGAEQRWALSSQPARLKIHPNDVSIDFPLSYGLRPAAASSSDSRGLIGDHTCSG